MPLFVAVPSDLIDELITTLRKNVDYFEKKIVDYEPHEFLVLPLKEMLDKNRLLWHKLEVINSKKIYATTI